MSDEQAIEEVTRLRQQNSQLLELNDALKEGQAALKDANAALRELVTSLQNERAMLVEKNERLTEQLGMSSRAPASPTDDASVGFVPVSTPRTS